MSVKSHSEAPTLQLILEQRQLKRKKLYKVDALAQGLQVRPEPTQVKKLSGALV
jgi:hypothetical protein